MRYSRIVGTLALASITFLFILTISPVPVLAAGTINTSRYSGPVGTPISVSGTGFTTPATYQTYFAYGTSWMEVVGSGAVEGGGAIYDFFSVPECPRASYTIWVQTSTPEYAGIVFMVTPEIGLSKASDYVGGEMTASGIGFAASKNVTVTFDGISVTTAFTNANGSFADAIFTVPESYKGSHTVRAEDASNNYDTISFTTKQSTRITPQVGITGDEVTLSGTGFRANRSITITFDASVAVTSPASVATDGNGSFSTSFTIPSLVTGTHQIEASDGTNTDSANFTVAANASLSQTTGYVGSEVTVSATGFQADHLIIITFANIQVGTATTDANGSFSSQFTVPSLVTGTHQIEASDGTNTDSANFTVVANAILSQTTGYVGSEIALSGAGFVGTVTIKYDDVEVATATATGGTFSATFTVPSSTGGNHTVTVSDGINTVQTTFVMESEAPPTPVTLLPEADSKARGEAYFDWEGVSDPSLPVTYTLQVAREKTFTIMVLEKKGLTASEYTITESEKLESTKKEAPYYWRVKAVDGAFNESAWSGAKSFHVGFYFSFTLPGWLKWTFVGVGGLLLLALGFWLGRKTAYSDFSISTTQAWR